MAMPEPYAAQAAALLQRLAERCRRQQPVGYMSVSLYDTAWVAMVQRPDGGWLLPEAYAYLLKGQAPEGHWRNGSAKDAVDGLLSTMAGLLCLLKRRARGVDQLDARIQSAHDWLRLELQGWDVDETDHVAFEILVPSLLGLLRAEGVDLVFPGQKRLTELYNAKAPYLKPEYIYGPKPSSLLHSLEAFAGKLDFDRVAHHLVNGSLMNSPSSTAAYLIYATSWDASAEEYLRTVVTHGAGNASGGVPSAFPSVTFDLSWVLSTLLEVGCEKSDDVEAIADHLTLTNGVAGFAPGIMPDSDDTAKSILALSLAGRPTEADGLIETFYNGKHFKTYPGERNPSFSANCNALMAILHLPDPGRYHQLISSVLEFLCESWYTGFSRDKWNVSAQYSLMLLSRVLTHALARWEEGTLFMAADICQRVAIVLAQIVAGTVRGQSDADGSWGGEVEITAYGLLTLKAVAGIPWFADLQTDLAASIERGAAFLTAHPNRWTAGCYTWVEKTTYASAVLSETYCLAAMAAPAARAWTAKVGDLIRVPAHAAKLRQFFARLPLFARLADPDRHLRLAFLEGYALLPLLRRSRHEIFERAGMAKDQYVEYIPLIWAACDLRGSPLPTATLIEMVRISLFNYQIDEFMETAVADCIPEVKRMIRSLCSDSEGGDDIGAKRKRTADAHSAKVQRLTNGAAAAATKLMDVEATLGAYVERILDAPHVRQSPAPVRAALREEVASFLLAHVTQLEDNQQLAQAQAQAGDGGVFAARESYFDWVRGTAATHTSCPFSFTFFACLVASPGKRCFPGVRAAYLARALRGHLATMCRQYNDFGSIARDRAEGNLNSVDFPEFAHAEASEAARKAELFWLAEYEREGLDRARERLRHEVPAATADAWDIFINVTDVFGQIYVARDIASRVK